MENSSYKELKEKLIKASNAYYKESKSIMSDYDFDMGIKELEKIEKEQGFADPDSPTQKVGSDLLFIDENNFHGRPMLSLANTYTMEDVEKWYTDMLKATGEKTLSVVVESKWDGGSAALRFKNGRLTKALTRGDSIHGEDMTQNINECLKHWGSINFTGEARGEVIMTTSSFNQINAEQAAKGLKEFQNARNLVSGSLKILDVNEFKPRAKHIKFYAYWLENSKNKTYAEDMDELKAAGFETGDYYLCNSFEEIKAAIEKIEINAVNLPVAIDGAVMKLNNKTYWESLGNTSHSPRWAKAFKYHQATETSKVVKIEFNTGRTGKVTPRIWFEPTFIDGSTVEKATMNNYEFYNDMNIAVGDTIEFQKAAAIIPQITRVLERPAVRGVYPFPTKCPCCGTKLVKKKEEFTDIFCMNENCSSRIVNQVLNYTHIMKIDGFGDILAERLNDAGLLNSISDLYRLKNHKVIIGTLDRMSENIATTLCENIEKQKNTDFWRVIAGLGIPNVGPKTAKMLAKHFKTMKVLQSATSVDLQDVEDIGEIVANSVIEYFKNNKKLIQELTEFGVTMSIDISKEEEKPSINLEGKTFCITGALSLPRNKYIELIETCGGKVVGSVSKKTSYLITNDKTSGTTKNINANKLGIPILNEKELLTMCGSLALLKELDD